MKNNVSIKILGEDMKRILHAVEAWMDDFKIKNKFYINYIVLFGFLLIYNFYDIKIFRLIFIIDGTKTRVLIW